MYFSYMTLIFMLLYLDSAALVNGALFILEPGEGSTCQAGQPCSVTWTEDGVPPLLEAIGVTKVGLFHGNQQLVQTISPVNVATAHSMNFVPLPAAGPNSDAYYIAFQSTRFIGNDSMPYIGFSPFFSLTGMSGSFASPLAAAISSIPIPKSLATSSTSSGTRTVTVGTLSTLAPITTATPTTSVSKLSTSIKPTLTSTPTSTSTTSLAPSPSAAGASRAASQPLSLLFLAISSAFFLL